MVRHWWPYFGLTTTLKVAAHCASLTSISAGQRRNGQVVDAAVDLYGSDAQGTTGSWPPRQACLWHHRQRLAVDLLGGLCAVGVSRLSATADRAHDDFDGEPEDDKISDHLPGDHEPGCTV
jgi:hypothetical protein